MTAEARLIHARREAAAARSRFAATGVELQQRLQPSTLANGAWEGVREKSETLADDAIRVVRERPVAASGVAAAAVLFVAREPIWSAVSRWFGRLKRKSSDGPEPTPNGERLSQEQMNNGPADTSVAPQFSEGAFS